MMTSVRKWVSDEDGDDSECLQTGYIRHIRLLRCTKEEIVFDMSEIEQPGVAEVLSYLAL